MMPEELIQHILSRRQEVSRETLLEKLEDAKRKTGGLIADATLLRLIATEYGVEIHADNIYSGKLSISQLIPNLGDVTVSGLVVAVYPPRTFEGKKSGKYASLVVTDKDELLRVMLWNDKVDSIESGALKTGDIVRLSHGYTREDRNGKVELHLGEKGKIEINPQDLSAKDFPSIGKHAMKIKEIAAGQKNIHIVGVAKSVFPSTTFARQDLSTGRVLRFTLADDTGEVKVVAWNEKAEEIEPCLRQDAKVHLVNAKAKAASDSGLEIHVDSSTYVGITEIAETKTKIASLREDLRNVTVKGEISGEPAVREVTTSKGETVKLAVFELKDETGTIRVSAWRKLAQDASTLKAGDKLLLANVYVKRGFGDGLELSTRDATVMTVL